MALRGRVEKAFSDDQKIEMVYDMLVRKGDDAAGAVQRRICAGQGVTVHGHFFSSSVIEAALRRFKAGLENTPNQKNAVRSRKECEHFLEDELDDSIDKYFSDVDGDLWRAQMETLSHGLCSEGLKLAELGVKARRASHGSST